MKRKWRINWKTVARNLFVILTAAVLCFVVYTIKTKGISFISTIGYFD